MSDDNEARAHGRECFARRAWADAFAELSAADRDDPLEPEDLERLAIAAHLVGRDAESAEVWTRAHHAFCAGATPRRRRPLRVWIGFALLNRGESPAAAAGSPGPSGCSTRAGTTAWSGAPARPRRAPARFAARLAERPTRSIPGRRDRRAVRRRRTS